MSGPLLARSRARGRVRTVRLGLVVVGMVAVVAAIGAWRLAPPQSSDALQYLGPGPSGMVGWSLGAPGGGPAFRPDAAQDATVVLVAADWWPACSRSDQDDDAAWLRPEVSYLPWSVTITLRESDSYASDPCRMGYYDFWGQAVAVHLSEPLGGRPLFDGSSDPSEARPYP